jgi:hypothetical protein
VTLELEAVPTLGPAELDPALAEALAAKVERLGYLGEFFGRLAHQPAALLAFQQFSQTTRAALGERLAEIVALTVSMRLGDDYERFQHERLCVRLGFGRSWVAAVEQLNPAAATPLDAQERAAQAIALAMVDGPGPASRELVRSYALRNGAAAAAALLLMIGRDVAHAAIVDALAIAPPVPSIFADGFDGD